ncbi:MAG: hypothetical protein PHQ74_12205 [Crocinitomicaceae bacterium]|nr:hypothetical protein [Crocinitomicaceae bacterium]
MKFLLSVLFLFCALGLFSQLQVTVSKSEFLIGETTSVYFEMNDFENDSKIDFNPWIETVKCLSLDQKSPFKELEILSFSDTIIIGNRNQFIGKYTLTAWDTGTFILPAHQVWINDEVFLFDTLRVHVSLPKTKDGQAIMESELPFQDFEYDPFYQLKKALPWILGSLFIVILTTWFFIKRKRKKGENGILKTVSKLPLLERTLQEISNLESKKLLEKRQIQTYFDESSVILKNYLGEQFDIQVLEKTSSEIPNLLISKGLSSSLILEIQTLFIQFDSVKFAKFNPSETESEELLVHVKACVLKINQWADARI